MGRHRLEIITRQAIFLGHCTYCDNVMIGFKVNPYKGQIDEYPERFRDWISRMSELIIALANRFRDMEIVIYNSVGVTGILKMLRYRVFREPVFILDGRVLLNGYIPMYREIEGLILKNIG